MNEPSSDEIRTASVDSDGQKDVTILPAGAGTIVETATGAAYGGALGAPGGPVAMVVGAVAGALASNRPAAVPEEGEDELP